MSIIAGFMVPHPPLIIPDVGRGNEHVVDKTIRSYERVGREILALLPETIIITSPHSILYRDYFHLSPGRRAAGNFGSFGAPQVSFDERYDEELVNEISSMAAAEGFPAGTFGERQPELDHGTMVPLYFIEKAYREAGVKTDFSIVRSGLSGFSLEQHVRFGEIIRKAVEETGRKAVFVASGDLSHKLQKSGPYGFDPAGPVYDEKIMDVMGRGAFSELSSFDERLLDEAAECGHRSFTIMGGAMKGDRLSIEKLSHEDVTGVGYGICTYMVL